MATEALKTQESDNIGQRWSLMGLVFNSYTQKEFKPKTWIEDKQSALEKCC